MTTEPTAQRLERATRLVQRGFFAASAQELDRCMAEFVAERNLMGQVRVHNIRGLICTMQNRDEDVIAPLMKAVELLREDLGPAQRVHFMVWTNMVRTYGKVERVDEALALVQQVSPLIHAADSQLQPSFYINWGSVCESARDWETMRFTSLMAIEKAAGDAVLTATARVNLGIAQMELGHLTEAEQSFREAIEVLTDRDPSTAATAEAALSRLYIATGQDERAVQVGRSALHRVFESSITPEKGEIGNISFSFGQIFAKYGQRNLALKYFNRAAAYFSQIGLRSRWLQTNEAIGQLLSSPVRPARADLREEMYQLDFLTALLDLIDDLESVEPSLRGHADRVSVLALNLGQRCGLADAELRRLVHAARLHDVGKSAIDVDLLRRQGALTQVEENRVSLHPILGEQMVRAYGLDADGLAGIRHHHEHWDGTGFPDRLAQKEIPLFARIIAVVNSYDVWTFGVGERPLLSHEEACARLLAEAGTIFDPEIVAMFLELGSKI